MNIEKSHWSSNGENLHLSVPFTKVNKEKRTVSGFATLDNLDQTGDLVTAEASLKAFENFRGNLREMHQPIAVGKVVSFKPETYYDQKTKQFYNGVYVTSYISKGAQDTWEKVLDGTLTGFSIGGKIKESENEVNKATGETVRFIKDYELVELSIVDSPANELCNIFSIEKVGGQMMFKGMAAEVVTENIFYCEESNSVFLSTEKTFESPVSGKPAVIIGWVEKSDVNKSNEVERILDSFKKSRLTLPDTQIIAKQANAEGGNEVSENTETLAPVEETVVEKVAEVVEAPVEEAPAVIAEADASADTVEKAADVSEVMVEEPDFAKMLGDLKGFFSETLTKATEANAAQVSQIQETVESFSKSVDARITELADQHSALSAAVTEIRNTMDGVQKRVDAVENDTAIKKSSDLGGSQEVTIKKSKWNGSFLGSVNELFN
jgi:flagellin-like hook-associated protein FlgL